MYQGSISVGVRIKPSSGKQDPWFVDNNTLIHQEFGEFNFDHIFSPEMNNQQVYERIASPMIDKLFEGFNCTIFAYGMTGSGKTFTMSGSDLGPGIIPMCVDSIFDRIEIGMPGKKFEVKVSYLEIYNERIFDLLNLTHVKSVNSNIMSGSSNLSNDLKIRDDPKYGVRVIGLVEREVKSNEDLMKCISIGDQNRKTGETDFNTRSSRSHAVVLIRVICKDETTGEHVTSTLSLCDLAGSERATGQQERRKEGSYINKSLLALGTVISKLSIESSSASANAGHIPYRDSKLTRILQPALSGDSLVATICTIDTKPETSTESLNTIRFASRAKNIGLNVKKNESDSGLTKSQIILNLRKQIREQQLKIDSLTHSGSSLSNESIISNEQSFDKLRRENELLRAKSSHLEKLQSIEPRILQDQELIEIVDTLPLDIGIVLESKLANIDAQLREMKEYISLLEERAGSTHGAKDRYIKISGSDLDLTKVLHDQESELMELQKAIERKDKIIDALRSAKRLRNQISEFTGTTSDSDTTKTTVEAKTVSNVLQPLSLQSSDLNKQEKVYPSLSKLNNEISVDMVDINI